MCASIVKPDSRLRATLVYLRKQNAIRHTLNRFQILRDQINNASITGKVKKKKKICIETRVFLLNHVAQKNTYVNRVAHTLA